MQPRSSDARCVAACRRSISSTNLKDVIKLATAVVGTLSALALGLLVATAKSAHDGAAAGLSNSAAHIVLLDRVMAHYGPETREAREALRNVIKEHLDASWETGGFVGDDAENVYAGIEPVQDVLRALTPKTDAQRWLQARALDVSGRIAEAHWLLLEASEETLPRPFLVVMTFWLSVIFATFGLLSPRNPTVLLVLMVCASDAPLRDARATWPQLNGSRRQVCCRLN